MEGWVQNQLSSLLLELHTSLPLDNGIHCCIPLLTNGSRKFLFWRHDPPSSLCLSDSEPFPWSSYEISLTSGPFVPLVQFYPFFSDFSALILISCCFSWNWGREVGLLYKWKPEFQASHVLPCNYQKRNGAVLIKSALLTQQKLAAPHCRTASLDLLIQKLFSWQLEGFHSTTTLCTDRLNGKLGKTLQGLQEQPLQHASVIKTKELFLNCPEVGFSCFSPVLLAQAVKWGNLDLLTPCNLPKKSLFIVALFLEKQ